MRGRSIRAERRLAARKGVRIGRAHAAAPSRRRSIAGLLAAGAVEPPIDRGSDARDCRIGGLPERRAPYLHCAPKYWTTAIQRCGRRWRRRSFQSPWRSVSLGGWRSLMISRPTSGRRLSCGAAARFRESSPADRAAKERRARTRTRTRRLDNPRRARHRSARADHARRLDQRVPRGPGSCASATTCSPLRANGRRVNRAPSGMQIRARCGLGNPRA
jgi:hypothetical protein